MGSTGGPSLRLRARHEVRGAGAAAAEGELAAQPGDGATERVDQEREAGLVGLAGLAGGLARRGDLRGARSARLRSASARPRSRSHSAAAAAIRDWVSARNAAICSSAAVRASSAPRRVAPCSDRRLRRWRYSASRCWAASRTWARASVSSPRSRSISAVSLSTFDSSVSRSALTSPTRRDGRWPPPRRRRADRR